MTLAEIMQLVALKLGEQNAFYPPEEVVRSGINPAQRLMCFTYPLLLTKRFTYIVPQEVPWIDLRTLEQGQIRKVSRVMLGDVTSDTPVRAETGELRELKPVALRTLIARNDWMRQRGEVRHYWLFGACFLGVYKRPVTDTTVTIVYDAIPTVLDINAPDSVPDVQSAYHPLIAEVATGLLLLKEGLPQGQLGLEKVTTALNLRSQAA